MSPDTTGLVFSLICFVLYFLPAANAYGRGHHQKVPILVLNLFLGWTVLGWILTLAWSASAIHTHGYLNAERR